MASSGKNTRQYKKITECTSVLRKCMEDHLVEICDELLSARLISNDVKKRLINPYQDTEKRATELISTIATKIELDPTNFDRFIEVLRKDSASYGEALRVLESSQDFYSPGVSDQSVCDLALPEVVFKSAKNLKAWYKKLSVIPDDPKRQWPPTLGQQYYELSLLERPRELLTTSTVSSYLTSLSKGNISSDFPRFIDLKDMFACSDHQVHPEAKILVTGVPGIGKTTLARKVSYEWAIDNMFQNFSLVLLFSLKEERVYRAKEIQDLVGYHSLPLKMDVALHLEETLGAGVLFIFDGWDELPTSLQNSQSIFIDMIRNKVLPNCSILVTVRSYAAGDLIKLPSVTKHIEVIGFTSKEITECIKSYIPNTDNAEKLLWQLKVQQHIMSACYVPLNFAIVLHIAKFRNYILPKTLTEMFQIFILNALLRHIKGLPEYHHIKSLRYIGEMPTKIQRDFDNLCKLALNGLANEKVTFFHGDIAHYFPSLKPDQIRELDTPFLGLLTSMQSFSEYGEEDQYQFLHVTTQEFLAAWRVAFHSDYTPDAKIAFLNEYRDNKRFYRTFIFFAGLTHFHGANFLPVLNAPVQFSELPTHGKLSGGRTGSDYILFVAELLFEAQDPNQTAIFASNIHSARLQIKFDPSSALRSLITLLHFLWNSKKSWNIIELINTDVASTRESPFQFYESIASTETCTRVDELKLENFLCLQDILILVNIPPFNTTKKITLTRYYEPFETELICAILAERNWLKLGLSLWDASNFNVQPIFEILTHTQSVNAFYLDMLQEEERLPFDPSGQTSLCTLLAQNHTLHSLHLTRCGINSQIAKQLAQCLSTKIYIKILELSDNPLGREGHTVLFQSLIVNSTVTHMILRRTSDQDEESSPLQLTNLYKSMIQMFTLNKTLIVLDLSLNSHFDAKLGKWIAAGIKVNRTLEKMYLDHVGIPANGIMIIFLSLEENKSLKVLSLSGRNPPHWLTVGDNAARTFKLKMSGFLGSLMNLMEVIQSIPKKLLDNCDTALCKQIEENLQNILAIISQLDGSIDELAKYINTGTEHIHLALASRAVQNVLQENNLQVLDLRSCHIFAGAIATGLSRNQSLVEIQVGGYPITSNGLTKIFRSVSHNVTLQKLIVEDIKVEDNALEALIQMLLCNKTLTCLGLYKTSDISEIQLQKIIRVLHDNQTLSELILPEEYTSLVIPELTEVNHKRLTINHSPVQIRCAPQPYEVLSRFPIRYLFRKINEARQQIKQGNKLTGPLQWTFK